MGSDDHSDGDRKEKEKEKEGIFQGIYKQDSGAMSSWSLYYSILLIWYSSYNFLNVALALAFDDPLIWSHSFLNK